MREDLILQYDLQFFAKDGPGGEKTEPATGKKLNDARKEGQTAKSKELVTSIMLLSLFLVIKFYIGNMGQQMILCFSKYYDQFAKVIRNGEQGLRMQDCQLLVRTGLTDVLNLAVPFYIVAFVVAFGKCAAAEVDDYHQAAAAAA
jgi:flagellar biosynthetic protein FlhB